MVTSVLINGLMHQRDGRKRAAIPLLLSEKEIGFIFKAGLEKLSFFDEAENIFFTKDNSTIKFSKRNDNVIRMEFDVIGLGVVIVNAQKAN